MEPRSASSRENVSIHAPAWGATLRDLISKSAELGFNPRPRVGGDTIIATPPKEESVSIHAPRGGRPGKVRRETGF